MNCGREEGGANVGDLGVCPAYPDNGKTYSCKIKLVDNELKVRGYIGISLFGRTTVWAKK